MLHALLGEGNLGCKFKDIGQQGYVGEKSHEGECYFWKENWIFHGCEKHLVADQKAIFVWKFHFVLFVFTRPTEICRNKIGFQIEIEGGYNLHATLDFHVLAVNSFTN